MICLTRQTNAVSQGALLAAIATVLGLSAIFIPILGVVASVLWGLPIIVLIFRFDFRTGAMALAVALTIIGMTAGPLGALSLGLKSGLTALVFGYALKKNFSPGVTVLGGGIAAVIGTGIFLLLLFLFMGGGFLVPGEVEPMVDQYLEFYEQNGFLKPFLAQGISQEELRQQLSQMVALVIALIPGALFIGSLVTAGITYLMARLVLRRLGYKLVELTPFRNWRLPWYTIWGLIIGLAALLAGDYWEQKFLILMGQNIIYVYLPFLLLSGITVVTYYYYKWPLSPLVKGIIIALIIINLPITIPTLLLIGTFDPLFNYRKLSLRRNEKE